MEQDNEVRRYVAEPIADRYIRSHDTPSELRCFAYSVRDLASERDRLAAENAALRERMQRIRAVSDELVLSVGNDVLVEQHADYIVALAEAVS